MTLAAPLRPSGYSRLHPRWRYAVPPLLVAAAFGATILFGLAIPQVPALVAFNTALFHAINGLSCGATADNPVFWVMWTGMNQPINNYILLYAIGAIYVLRYKRDQWRRFLAVGVGIAAIGFISNPVIWQWAWGPRPYTMTDACILYPEWKPVWSQYSSYPSGHARETAAEIALISTFWPRFLPFGLLYVLLLCFSRLYIGVHFPLDVIVGSLLGWAIARIAFLAYDVYAVPLLERSRTT